MLLGKQLLTSAKHVLDLFAKTVTSAISLWRHAWLRSTDLQLDTKLIVEDLPFEGGMGLFSTTTDTVLQEMDKRHLGFWASRHRLRAPSLSHGPDCGLGTNILDNHWTRHGSQSSNNRLNRLFMRNPSSERENNVDLSSHECPNRGFDSRIALHLH